LAGPGPQAGQGSGFVVSDDGEIVTNAHVVTDGQAEGSADINPAREVYVQFPDRNQVEAEIVGFDPFADVALLEVPPEGLEIDPIELGSLDGVEVGDPVAAIGSPFGERQSLSVGVISATNRSIPSLTDFRIDGALQTDASINPGNSGGPLLDAEGKVIGINQQIDTTSGGNQGVGFAVPIDLVSRSIEQLRDDGTVDYAFIGVETQPLYPQLSEELEIDSQTGALIANVVPDGPADQAGLCCTYSEDEEDENTIRFQATEVVTGGDVIVSVEGEDVVAEADLPRIIARQEPGDEVTLEIIRDGERMDVDVELGTRPATE
jgi:S1-C subfamily serine protease